MKNPLTGVIGSERLLKNLRGGAIVSTNPSTIKDWVHIRIGGEVAIGCKKSDAPEFEQQLSELQAHA